VTLVVVALSALVAGAMTPVSAKVSARQIRGVPLWAVPLAGVFAGALSWSMSQVTSLNLGVVLAVSSVSAVLATQFVIDVCVRRLLRELSYAGFVVFLVSMLFVGSGAGSGVTGALVGAVAMTAVTALLVLGSRGALGMGDLHLSPLLGALLGWFSPSAVLLAWMVTAISGALFTVIGLATKRVARGTMIPYGPFMMFGTVFAAVVYSVRL